MKSYVKSKLLTRDSDRLRSYDADPLIFRQIAVNVLLDLHDTANRLVADAGAIQTPTLMIGAGRDWVVSLKAQREFFNRLSSPLKEMEIYPALITPSFTTTIASGCASRVVSLFRIASRNRRLSLRF